jgi:nitrate reductase gamma subunit
MTATSLLEFARGPALTWSIAIFIAGVLWRLVGIFLLRTRKDLSEPRNRATWHGLRLIALRSWPRKEFLAGTAFGEVMGYTFHVGFLAALLFLVPHVLFFGNVFGGLLGADFSDLFGVRWPTLPTGIVTFLSAIALAALVAVLIHRLTSPVKRLISNFDDYWSWLLTAAPLATGMLAYAHAGGAPYETLLGAHILSAEALMIWFPFGKLMHAFTIFAARGSQGMLFERRGASL